MLKKILQIILILCILPTISACGLKPIYSTKQVQYNQHLKKIYVEPLDSIEGSEYYESILSLLQPSSQTEYVLISNLSFNKGISVLLPNSDIVHEKATAQINYRLIHKDTNKELTSGDIKQTLSYSATFSPYTNYIIAEDAKIKLATNIAEEVRNRLLFYFVNQHETIQ